jgi:aryl-alcohol dehydrogenase-like predicted oxidoreductase
VISSALKYLIKEKNYERSQIMIASKAGFIRKSEEIGGEFEVINDHCVDPKFLEISLRKSL